MSFIVFYKIYIYYDCDHGYKCSYLIGLHFIQLNKCVVLSCMICFYLTINILPVQINLFNIYIYTHTYTYIYTHIYVCWYIWISNLGNNKYQFPLTIFNLTVLIFSFKLKFLIKSMKFNFLYSNYSSRNFMCMR